MKDAAIKGNAKAQLEYGLILCGGFYGEDQNSKKGTEFLSRAEASCDPDVTLKLAEEYLTGKSIKSLFNTGKGIKLLEDSVTLGSALGQKRMADGFFPLNCFHLSFFLKINHILETFRTLEWTACPRR